MKRYSRNFALILIITAVFLLTGCKNIRLKVFKDNNEPKNNIENNVNDDSNIIDESGSDITKSENNGAEKIDVLKNTDEPSDTDNPTPTVIQPTQNVELLIYVVNNAADLDPVYALVPADEEITPQLIVETVVDSMADRSILIGIESVTTEGDTVIVSFYSDKAPLKDVGASFESAILDAIAQSLVENLEDYNKVIYRVEGGPYISGHIELEKDEVYFEDNR